MIEKHNSLLNTTLGVYNTPKRLLIMLSDKAATIANLYSY